jgi:hypothetical protein
MRLANITISRARATAKYKRTLRRSLPGAVVTAPRVFKKDLSLEDLRALSADIENQAGRK